MLRLITYIFLVIAIVVYMVSITEAKKKAKRKIKHGPKGMSLTYSTSCNEFSKNARFSPFSVLNENWFVFFYWAPPTPMQVFHFSFPSANDTKFLHKMFDDKVTLAVDWSARQILMQDKYKVTSLLVERSESGRGHYWQYMLHKMKDKLIEPRDVRLKQVNAGRLLGFMDCKSEIVYVMSRINEVPPKTRIQDEAAKLGYRGRRGKSYLYQGHEWMPIPEADERLFWAKPQSQESETDSQEDSSKEENARTTNECDESKTLNNTEVSESNNDLKETSCTKYSNSQPLVNENFIDTETQVTQSSNEIKEVSLIDIKTLNTVDNFNGKTSRADPDKTELIELHSIDYVNPKSLSDKAPIYKYTYDLDNIQPDETSRTTDKLKNMENTTKQELSEVTELVTDKTEPKESSTVSIRDTNNESAKALVGKKENVVLSERTK